jgi:hypothetical protein
MLNSWYVVTFIFQSTLKSKVSLPYTCEEKILLVSASNALSCYEKAIQIGYDGETTYENIYGETVEWTFLGIEEISLLEDPIQDGGEIRTHTFTHTNPKSLIRSKEELQIFSSDSEQRIYERKDGFDIAYSEDKTNLGFVKSNIQSHNDILTILEKVNKLIDQTVTEVDAVLSRGIYLNFGEQRRRLLGKANQRVIIYPWQLNLLAGNFQLLKNDYIYMDIQISSTQTDSRLLNFFQSEKIVQLDIEYPTLELIVKFTNSKTLRSIPNISSEWNVPYYQFFTPENMVLEIGPKFVWSYRGVD